MIDEKKLEERLVALEAAKSWSPRVVSRLETLLRSGADEALYRINPIQFATEKSISEAEAIDLFLHSCVAGLFDMDWLLICPMCSDVVESFRSLRKLHTHFHCNLCRSDYEAALDDYIAVTFTVSPAVRGIRFHDPDALSAWDYAFVCKWTPGGRLADGVAWSEVCKSLTKAMSRVASGCVADLEVDAAAGAVLGFDMDSDAQFLFVVEGEAAADTRRIPIMVNAGKCAPDAAWLFAFLYFLFFTSIGIYTWWMGSILGLIHGTFLLVCVIPLLPFIHPRMASEHHGVTNLRQLEPPGFLAMNYGYQTPLATLVAQAAYGGVLGACVQIQHAMMG